MFWGSEHSKSSMFVNYCHQLCVSFIRASYDWEVYHLYIVQWPSVLKMAEPVWGKTLFWIPSKKGLFEVKSFYNALFPMIIATFSGEVSKAPPRATFIVWTADFGVILTVDNLRLQHIIEIDWCCVSKESGETVDRLLLHYLLASYLQKMIFCLFGLDWVMPSVCGSFCMLEMTICWPVEQIHAEHKFSWLWYIWRERNNHTFIGCEKRWRVSRISFLIDHLTCIELFFYPLVFRNFLYLFSFSAWVFLLYTSSVLE